METLPDYLTSGLDIVFVGINPGAHSAKVGHYFATPTNRFWPAVRQAGLVSQDMTAQTDHRILEFGIGFTDVVKRPSHSASDLRSEDFRRWSRFLKDKLLRYQPRIVCFQGLTGYRNYLRYADGDKKTNPELGLQPRIIGVSKVFVVPNPSPANAVYRLDDLVGWYRELGKLRDDLQGVMIEQVRTFIAIELPPGVKRVMGDVEQELKAASPAPVRWVKPDNIHLTLKFLGNVDSALTPGLIDGVREAVAGLGPFHLSLAGLGAFPNPARARVVWVGLEGDLEPLADLQQRVEGQTAKLGFAKDERPFSPHLTLGRVNNASSDQQRLLKDALLGLSVPAYEGFEVNEIVVLRSELRPGGAVYTPLGRASL